MTHQERTEEKARGLQPWLFGNVSHDEMCRASYSENPCDYGCEKTQKEQREKLLAALSEARSEGFEELAEKVRGLLVEWPEVTDEDRKRIAGDNMHPMHGEGILFQHRIDREKHNEVVRRILSLLEPKKP